MAKELKQQILQQLEEKTAIAIFLPQTPSIDALSSAMVLRQWCIEHGKEASIISENFQTTEKLSFLLDKEIIEPVLRLKKQTFIEIDTKQFPVADLSYQKHGDTLRVVLTPKEKPLAPNAFKFETGPFQFDLIITLNVVELAAIGDATKEHRTFFEQIPVINIDHRAENEQYGHINWIELTSSSTAQMLYQLLYQGKSPAKRQATLLLAGIMDATHAFRSKNLSSETLTIVSKLLQSGAQHEDLVNNLYRTKSLGMLRLWGYALDHLQADRDYALAWSLIPKSVFETTGTTRREVNDLMDEILSHSPEAKTVLLFMDGEEKNSVEVEVQTTSPLNAKDLLKNWQPIGSERRATAIIRESNLAGAEARLVSAVKERLHSVLKK